MEIVRSFLVLICLSPISRLAEAANTLPGDWTSVLTSAIAPLVQSNDESEGNAAAPSGDDFRLEGDAITEGAIAQLGGRKWNRVALIGGRIDARIVENLRHATSIHALELFGERLSGQIPRLEHVHGLVELTLGAPLVGQDLEAIGRLVQLEALQLPQDLTINASGAREIAQLTNLKSLNLCRVNIDDSGIAELSTLKQLEQLDLTHTRVTDEGLKVLAHMPKLRTLELYRHPSWHIKQQISDKCLAVIVQLTDLERLSLSGKITNEGLVQVAKLPRLKHLSILGTEVTSAGLGALEGSGIESLRISADQLGQSTDVAKWKKLKALKYVHVVGKFVSLETIEEWRKALPNIAWVWLS